MKTYRVALTLNERELLKFLDRPEAVTMTVEAEQDEEPAVNEPEAVYRPKRGPRQHRQRRSKVIDTIVGVLQKGANSPAVLKQALIDAGLSPGSLGTGLAILQKEGGVKRNEHGDYFLARPMAQEAAE